jgi:hypothetical protein
MPSPSTDVAVSCPFSSFILNPFVIGALAPPVSLIRKSVDFRKIFHRGEGYVGGASALQTALLLRKPSGARWLPTDMSFVQHYLLTHHFFAKKLIS